MHPSRRPSLDLAEMYEVPPDEAHAALSRAGGDFATAGRLLLRSALSSQFRVPEYWTGDHSDAEQSWDWSRRWQYVEVGNLNSAEVRGLVTTSVARSFKDRRITAATKLIPNACQSPPRSSSCAG